MQVFSCQKIDSGPQVLERILMVLTYVASSTMVWVDLRVPTTP